MKWLIKKYMIDAHIDSMIELAKRTGMSKFTLYDRIANPQSLRLFELMALDKILNFSDEDLCKLARGEL